jgi:uncharacterized protein YbcI
MPSIKATAAPGIFRGAGRMAAMSTIKSRGMLEAEISEAMIKFERDYMGRGPTETRTYIVNDMIVSRLSGVMTRAEETLARTGEGMLLVKKVRSKLLEEARPILDGIISGITGARVVSMHTDISTTTGERIIVFIVDAVLEERVRKNPPCAPQ